MTDHQLPSLAASSRFKVKCLEDIPEHNKLYRPFFTNKYDKVPLAAEYVADEFAKFLDSIDKTPREFYHVYILEEVEKESIEYYYIVRILTKKQFYLSLQSKETDKSKKQPEKDLSPSTESTEENGLF